MSLVKYKKNAIVNEDFKKLPQPRGGKIYYFLV